MESKIIAAADYLAQFLDTAPSWGLVLGSGLNGLADKIIVKKVIDYKEIPNFPVSTISGHEGKLIIGTLEGVSVIGLKGRKHYYECSDVKEVVFPVHVLAQLGVKNYFVTNAAGGLNTEFKVGDTMKITSHISSFFPNPLLGPQLNLSTVQGNDAFRFQPMNNCYDKELSKLLITDHEGVYVAVTGPNYETEAECIMLRKLGADTVGMSTVPEVIVARNRGMKVVGMSLVTNVISEDGTNATNHEEVKSILDSIEVKEKVENSVINFFKKVYQTI